VRGAALRLSKIFDEEEETPRGSNRAAFLVEGG
jgi:hypothetical protein